VLGLRIHGVAAIERELQGSGQGIPVVLDLNRRSGVPRLPQRIRDLAVDPRAATGWLEARQDWSERVPKWAPFRQAAGNELSRDPSSIQDGKLCRIAQRLRAEFSRQAFEQPVLLIAPRDDHHVFAAPQARCDEAERRLSECIATSILAYGIAVKLSEMSPGRRFG